MGYPDTKLVPPSEVAARGASVLNIHQGVDGPLNPYINYPFDRGSVDALAAYVADAHALGLKVKDAATSREAPESPCARRGVRPPPSARPPRRARARAAQVKAYYTVRELSNHVHELWVLRSLGSEVLPDGPGGGDPWDSEHLVDGYRPCWQNPLSSGEFDSALCNGGTSRWVNYYVEGLAASLRAPVHLDGIYYDGIGFGGHTMRRVRRVLQAAKGAGRGLIDLHCGNNFLTDSYGKVSPALQFMHLLPYVDSLWFGEGYDYSEEADYWLVEVSGLPFGLMGDMMRAGHTWRGMLYGLTTRYRTADPTELWQLWDAFGIQHASMHGYWQAEPPPPVAVDAGSCRHVRATAYVRRGLRTLIALASWDVEPRECVLRLDWAALGLEPRAVALEAAPLPSLGQPRRAFSPLPWGPRGASKSLRLQVDAQAGGLYVLSKRPPPPQVEGGARAR